MTIQRLTLALTCVMLTLAPLGAQQAPAGRGAGTGTGAGAGAGRGAQQPPPPAPAPGSPAIYKSNAELTEGLKQAMARANGEQSSAGVANTDQYRINVVHREKAAGALAHAGNTELHYIIEGSGTVVTGGTILRPAAGSGGGATIQNGETRRLQKGDVIVVPAGSPHWYSQVDSPITYLEVRFVAPTK